MSLTTTHDITPSSTATNATFGDTTIKTVDGEVDHISIGDTLVFEPPLIMTVDGSVLNSIGNRNQLRLYLENLFREEGGCDVGVVIHNQFNATIDIENTIEFDMKIDSTDEPTPNSDLHWFDPHEGPPTVVNENNSLPEAPSWEELGTWWNDDWGTWELEENATLVINDDGMPDSKKRELQEKHRSRVRVSYDSSDSSCTESNDMGDQTDITSKSFSERMNDLADDLDEQAREREEERIKQYLRDNRETFKAEITDVWFSKVSDEIKFEVDIPTHGIRTFRFDVPDGDGCGQRLYEILSYLNADLCHMDMIEGMYLPVSHENDEWGVQLPSDTDTRRWSLPSISRPSIEGMFIAFCSLGWIPALVWESIYPSMDWITITLVMGWIVASLTIALALDVK